METSFRITGAAVLAWALLAAAPTVSFGEDVSQTIVVEPSTGEVVSAVIDPTFEAPSDEEGHDAETTFVVDAATGEVIAQVRDDVGPSSARRGKCRSTEACWTSGYSIGDFAFHSLGVTTGSWPQRETFHSGPYTAKPCWRYDGPTLCASFWLAPHNKIVFTAPVTGVRVTLR